MKRILCTLWAVCLLAPTFGSSPVFGQESGSASGSTPGISDVAGWDLKSDGPHALNASIRETVWRAQRGPGGSHNQIEVHRYRTDQIPKAALLYLPGTNMNGEAALGDEDHNLWFFLALRGIEVYALDYRTHFVANAGVEDLGFMRDWTLATFIADAAEAAALARREGGHQRLFLAGFSRGVTLAYGLAVSQPADQIAGLVALDGGFKHHAPGDGYDLAAAIQKLIDSGVFAIDVAGSRGWEWRQDLMRRTVENPDGPPVDPAFTTVGQELSQVLYTAWGPGVLANPQDGFSHPEVLAPLLEGYDRYYPTIQNVEGQSIARSVDDPNSPVDDGWSELQTPVLYFGATGMTGWLGGDWLLNGIHSAVEAGGKDFTIHVLEGYGHLDVVVGEHARRDVFEPTLEWIERRLP